MYENQDEDRPGGTLRRSHKVWGGGLLVTIVIVAVVSATLAVSIYWVTNKPKAARKRPPAKPALVEVETLQRRSQKVVIRAMGTVVPVRSIELASRVGGEVIEVSGKLTPGEHVAAGEMLLRLEPTDYELQLKQRLNDLTSAETNLALEMGQQAVSLKEFEMLGQDIPEQDRDLLLRRPQLAMAKTAVDAAEASLQQAKLDLARTRIVTPFNALILDHSADLGSQVSPGEPLVSLVGTDEYYIELSVPLDELRWIDIPRTGDQVGSVARVYNEFGWGPKLHREGSVKRLLAELEPVGRMARILISVTDPLDLGAEAKDARPLLLGSYVNVQIEGAVLAEVMSVPRSALRDGNSVWVMDAEGTLDIRTVEIVFSDDDNIFVAEGLADGEMLITSDLPAPVQSMALREIGVPAGKPVDAMAQEKAPKTDGEAR